MKNQRFRDLPATEVIPLHFVEDEKQLDDWLNSLLALDTTLAAEKILQAISALEQADLKTSLKIKLLHKIHQFFPKIVNTLQKSYIDSSLPLSDQATHNVELVVWINMQLARALRQCKLKYVTLGKEQQAGLLYLSLDSLSQALLHISLSYKVPMPGFWAMCYELYARAEQANLTDITITLNVRNNESITRLFKHMLIFQLCDTQQFRCRDILMLFEYLSNASATAHILANYQPKWQAVVCMFNLNKDLPPQKINPTDAHDDLSERFITSVSVAKSMYDGLQKTTALAEQPFSNNAIRSINHEALLRALNTLGLARKRKFTRVAEKTEFTGIVGLGSLIEYLQSKTDIGLISPEPIKAQADAKPLKSARKTQFDLIPIGEEVAHHMRDNAKQGQNEQLTKLFSFGTEKSVPTQNFQRSQAAETPGKSVPLTCQFEMQDSSAKGYGLVVKLPTTQVKIGDIIAVITHKTERIEVGIVRRINQMPNQQLRLGVEVISFESELVFVSNPQQLTQGFWGILLPGLKTLKQADSLVYNSSLFKQGDIIHIKGAQNQVNYRLHKILQISAAATHMELLKCTEVSS
ncbi:MAG: hypothetical protein HOP02_12680 [Methylococcaceae bacterium]|nr:hypothetical protein [Methylococcaceae bacterium]